MEALEIELRGEKVSALRRIAAGLQLDLAALKEFESGPQAQQPDAAVRRAELRKKAARQLWYMVVQREAMGIRRHEDMYAIYEVPKDLVPNP